MESDSLFNITASNRTRLGWVEEPVRRGTLSILISCITTLVLCTWSAMHINVPRRNASSASYLKSQGFWSLIGIFGPELAIWTAWRQYMSAKALRDQVQAALLESGRLETMQEEWSITHAFYATMGGFVVDLDSPSFLKKPRFLRNVSRLTFTPKGILLLARCGFLPSVPRNEIQDKSKTDDIGKLLACAQALWMVAQVISRLVSGLPITLLEVTTIGHVLCAVILYSLWWHKPRWISEPTRLEGDWVPAICAFMCMASRLDDGGMDETDFQKRFAVDTAEISQLRYLRNRENRDSSADATDDVGNELNGTAAQRNHSYNGAFEFRPRTRSDAQKLEDIDVEVKALNFTKTIDPVTRYRHDCACQAIAEYPAIRSMMQYPLSESAQKYSAALRLYPEMPERARRRGKSFEPISKAWLECETEHLVCVSASNWPSEGLLRPTAGLAVGAVLWFSSIAFSAVHIAAWNESFPSSVETWLWHSSSIYVGFSGCLWSAVHLLAHMSGSLWWLWYDLLVGSGPKFLKYFLTVVCALCGLAYVFARLFLIVGAFAALRSLPAAAFLVPQWTVSVPHI